MCPIPQIHVSPCKFFMCPSPLIHVSLSDQEQRVDMIQKCQGDKFKRTRQVKLFLSSCWGKKKIDRHYIPRKRSETIVRHKSILFYSDTKVRDDFKTNRQSMIFNEVNEIILYVTLTGSLMLGEECSFFIHSPFYVVFKQQTIYLKW